MNGLMMRQPLLISSLLTHAQRHHGTQAIVSRRVEGGLHRTTFRALAAQARRIANALDGLGVRPGQRVATLAWNTDRHMALYYGVSGSGRVLHTLNPRLHADQLAWIVNDAQDDVLFFDIGFLPLVEAIASRVGSVRRFVAMTDRAHMPARTHGPELLCYEDLLDAVDDRYAGPTFDECAASSLCYTSGTTGDPKGVLYSHRSTMLHALAAALPSAFDIAADDVVLPVVPMFHVNAWGLPYVACMTGAKLVLPGPALDAASLHALIEDEGVTVSAGVPAVWQGLLSHVEAAGLGFRTMRRTIIGGSACPTAMVRAFQEDHGVQVLHAWGMTETSPVGTVCSFKHQHAGLDGQARLALQARQGHAIFGVDMKIVDDTGAELPWDGQASGELLVRGHWVVDRYYNDGAGDCPEGRDWFPTGDVATIDADGYMQITDRRKDVIKSGGEWISSIALENIAAAHPQVAMAACIATHHPKWEERPLLVVVRKPPANGVPDLTREALLSFYDGKVARWWMPDDIVFVDALPMGATGKVLKHVLRDAYREHRLPTA